MISVSTLLLESHECAAGRQGVFPSTIQRHSSSSCPENWDARPNGTFSSVLSGDPKVWSHWASEGVLYILGSLVTPTATFDVINPDTTAFRLMTALTLFALWHCNCMAKLLKRRFSNQ